MQPEHEQRTVTEDSDEKVETHEVKRVYEQRWSLFHLARAILLFFSPPVLKVVGLTPTSVLAGLFMFMGDQSLFVNPILYRTFYLLTPPSELPPLPIISLTKRADSPGPITRKTPTHPIFPSIFSFRLLVMKRWWPRGVLRFVDAWTCRERTPEDDEDVESKRRDDDGGNGVDGVISSRLGDSMNEPSNLRARTQARMKRGDDKILAVENRDIGHMWVELGFRTKADEELGRPLEG
ncbi:hypothetical protein EYZ11_008079 [Aspergillus tanneri]|uniref:Uncharacterized protein n=1 Tax=Aspergillus tanneri TaxID=1220188 RepID=A0A4S3JBE1_9EURO|nr:uncharacterized protein ATNIH1004_005811 [Aspergillus tanneri]KAA8647128.1 hypothetical protein ATNIH1004_005811 [Aspergillus tanneri]THC92463.1 hypothetical protein EYZ11_008079 [Aspergillus tanneri]